MRGLARPLISLDGDCFGECKQRCHGSPTGHGIVKKHVVDILDHAVVLNAKDPLSRQINSGPTKLFITQYQPTSENLLIDFAARIRAALPPPAELHSLKLRETSTSYAEWFAADNP